MTTSSEDSTGEADAGCATLSDPTNAMLAVTNSRNAFVPAVVITSVLPPIYP
jgi:hypothetical protein